MQVASYKSIFPMQDRGNHSLQPQHFGWEERNPPGEKVTDKLKQIMGCATVTLYCSAGKYILFRNEISVKKHFF